jgi:signal transduction histidine kinase
MAAVLDDPGVFVDRLRDYRRRLFEGLLWARVVIVLGLGAIMPGERQHGGATFHLLVAEWAFLLVWSLAGLAWRRPLFDLLDRHPTLIWIELGVFVQALIVGGGWRTPFDLYSWPAIGLASVFLPAPATLAAAGVACAAFAVGTLDSVARGDPLASGISSREAVGGLLGYAVVGLAFWYVRVRMDGLAEAAESYRVQATAARRAERRAAAAAERTEIAFALHSRLRQAFPAIALRLGVLRELARGDPLPAAGVERLAGHVQAADARLEALVDDLENGDAIGTGQRSTSGSQP